MHGICEWVRTHTQTHAHTHTYILLSGAQCEWQGVSHERAVNEFRRRGQKERKKEMLRNKRKREGCNTLGKRNKVVQRAMKSQKSSGGKEMNECAHMKGGNIRWLITVFLVSLAVGRVEWTGRDTVGCVHSSAVPPLEQKPLRTDKRRTRQDETEWKI